MYPNFVPTKPENGHIFFDGRIGFDSLCPNLREESTFFFLLPSWGHVENREMMEYYGSPQIE
jgi:hypothetical protein